MPRRVVDGSVRRLRRLLRAGNSVLEHGDPNVLHSISHPLFDGHGHGSCIVRHRYGAIRFELSTHALFDHLLGHPVTPNGVDESVGNVDPNRRMGESEIRDVIWIQLSYRSQNKFEIKLDTMPSSLGGQVDQSLS